MKYLSIFVILIFIAAAGSCSKKEGAGNVKPRPYEVSQDDSVKIVEAASRVMQLLKDDNFAEAVNHLYTFNKAGSSFEPLAAEEAEMLQKRREILPVKAFDIKSVSFSSAYDNTVVFDVYFSLDAAGFPNPATKTKMTFNVMRKDNNFYATLKNNK